MSESIDKARAALDDLENIRLLGLARVLLKVAKCPNEHCVEGTIQEGFGDGYEVFECQFCHDRKAVLA